MTPFFAGTGTVKLISYHAAGFGRRYPGLVYRELRQVTVTVPKSQEK